MIEVQGTTSVWIRNRIFGVRLEKPTPNAARILFAYCFLAVLASRAVALFCYLELRKEFESFL